MNEILKFPFPPNLDSIWNEEFARQLAASQGALSGLDQAVSLLHNPNLLMRPLLNKEAESSSRLEGTQASIEDVYKAALIDDPEKKLDVQEILNYETAMLNGIETIAKRPLDQFVIRQIHKQLLSGVRGENKTPGKYRTGDVWIGIRGTSLGAARYVPPKAIHVPALMEEFEKFINTTKMHPLIICGVMHHRFEAVHPFNDGNGRAGRLLITMYLVKAGILAKPMLYPSGYFERSREDYTEALHCVDTKQDWYSWLKYFLRAIEKQAILSLNVARQIDSLFKSDREAIQDQTAHISLLMLLEYCFKQPYLSVPLAVKDLDIPPQTARRYFKILEDKKILEYIGQYKRGEKVFINQSLLKILRQI